MFGLDVVATSDDHVQVELLHDIDQKVSSGDGTGTPPPPCRPIAGAAAQKANQESHPAEPGDSEANFDQALQVPLWVVAHRFEERIQVDDRLVHPVVELLVSEQPREGAVAVVHDVEQ